MRWSVSFVLLVLAAAHWVLAESAQSDELFDEAEQNARIVELIETLLESESAEQQAAGLLVNRFLRWAEWYTEPDELREISVSERTLVLIETADTPLARALLAQLCVAESIQSDCIRNGLDDAIVRYDDAELLARLTLTENHDTERLRDVIVEAQKLDERQMDHALLLLELMETHGEFTAAQAPLAPLTFSVNLAPPFSLFFKVCGSPSPDDPELDEACDQNVARMMEEGTSMMINSIGSAVSAQRRMAKGDPDAQALHDQWRASLREIAECGSPQINDFMVSADSQLLREYFEHWRQHGESSAWSKLAELVGVDCAPLEPSPLRRLQGR